MVGITRCSPVRILSSFFLVLVVSASVTVFINHSGTATQGIATDFYQKGHQFVNFTAVHHVNNTSMHLGDHQLGEVKSEQHVNRNTPIYITHVSDSNTKTVDVPTLLAQDIEGLKTFVFFIGYPRSGHSIIASMIDAHPNAIVAHEFNLFAKLVTKPQHRTLLESKADLLNTLYQNSHRQSVIGWRSNNTFFSRKGYNLDLSAAESWQGRFTFLRVIGDKSGGTTARAYRDDPHMFKTLYNSMMDLLKVPVRVIHAVRNPYDMIATRLLYRHSETKGVKGKFNETHRLRGVNVGQAVEGLRSEAQAVNEMVKDCNLSVFEIHNTDFVHDPKRWMQKLCDFLGLECSQSYLKMCDANTFKILSKTRYDVEWEDEVRHSVGSMIREFPFFNRYSYNSN